MIAAAWLGADVRIPRLVRGHVQALGSRMERQIWTGLKRQLEDDSTAHPA